MHGIQGVNINTLDLECMEGPGANWHQALVSRECSSTHRLGYQTSGTAFVQHLFLWHSLAAL